MWFIHTPLTWKVISKSIQSRDMLQPRQCMSLSFCRFRFNVCHSPNTDSVAVTWSVELYSVFCANSAKIRLSTRESVFLVPSFDPKYSIDNLFSVWAVSKTVCCRKLNMCSAVFFVQFTSRLFIDQINRFSCVAVSLIICRCFGRCDVVRIFNCIIVVELLFCDTHVINNYWSSLFIIRLFIIDHPEIHANRVHCKWEQKRN